MEAKIGDFGLSCEGPSGRYTHCKVTKLQGTQFYLPHEYLKDHHLSDKVDVYSYGIVSGPILHYFKNLYHEISPKLKG
ncbi:hypothetical protein LAZ67_6003857 [Cordylochernes scorpioides]|uniref:Protein kinase domain-containing protein n=1 Tax=Cordylochernes scorpioides TaxID=51811 RepID=A0ABY6KP32_9ARAC|nr:hypothetical protein LAZ67_6003857 [Cordylochernes scorpioides]